MQLQRVCKISSIRAFFLSVHKPRCHLQLATKINRIFIYSRINRNRDRTPMSMPMPFAHECGDLKLVEKRFAFSCVRISMFGLRLLQRLTGCWHAAPNMCSTFFKFHSSLTRPCRRWFTLNHFSLFYPCHSTKKCLSLWLCVAGAVTRSLQNCICVMTSSDQIKMSWRAAWNSLVCSLISKELMHFLMSKWMLCFVASNRPIFTVAREKQEKESERKLMALTWNLNSKQVQVQSHKLQQTAAICHLKKVPRGWFTR